MLQQIRTVLALVVIVLALFNIILNNINIFPFMLVAFAALLVVVGIIEFQKKKTALGIISILISVFLIFVAIQGFVIG